MTRETASGRFFTLSALAAAALGILAVYSAQFDTGLYYDDYHFVRPLRPLDWRRVWYGSWDPTGIESPFFRPLTAWLFGFRFWLFGLNTQALHWVSLTGHAACALLVGWFLRREDVPAPVAIGGAWLYTIHPVFPYAQASWITNQMHLTVSLLVLATLVTWQSVRDRPLIWWFLLLATAVPAFLVKEDAVMLLPIVGVLTAARAWLRGEFDWKRLSGVGAFLLLAVTALVAFRQHRLGRIGGYGIPDFRQANINFWKGLSASLLLWPTRTPWQGIASATAMAAIGTGLWLSRRTLNRTLMAGAVVLVALLSVKLPTLFYDIPYPLLTWQGVASGIVVSASFAGLGAAIVGRSRRSLFVMAAGVAIAVGFNVPFILVSKREQYHLLGLGAVLVLAGAADALTSTATRRRRALAVALLLTLPVAALTRTQAASFLPCAETVLQVDPEAAGWWIVPDELRTWIHEKKILCGRGEEPPGVTDLPLVTWGVLQEGSTSEPEPYTWTADHVVLLVQRERRSLALALRRPDASPAAPVTVRVSGGARPVDVLLDSGDWKYATVPLTPSLLTLTRRAHRVDLEIAPPFVPALRDPASTDIRRYGVHLRIVDFASRRRR